MKKWATISQMATALCKADRTYEEGDEINIAQASRICKHVCEGIAKYGWKYTRNHLDTTLKFDKKLIEVNKTQRQRILKILDQWFVWYWFPCSGIRRRMKSLVAFYKNRK